MSEQKKEEKRYAQLAITPSQSPSVAPSPTRSPPPQNINLNSTNEETGYTSPPSFKGSEISPSETTSRIGSSYSENRPSMTSYSASICEASGKQQQKQRQQQSLSLSHQQNGAYTLRRTEAITEESFLPPVSENEAKIPFRERIRREMVSIKVGLIVLSLILVLLSNVPTTWLMRTAAEDAVDLAVVAQLESFREGISEIVDAIFTEFSSMVHHNSLLFQLGLVSSNSDSTQAWKLLLPVALSTKVGQFGLAKNNHKNDPQFFIVSPICMLENSSDSNNAMVVFHDASIMNDSDYHEFYIKISPNMSELILPQKSITYKSIPIANVETQLFAVLFSTTTKTHYWSDPFPSGWIGTSSPTVIQNPKLSIMYVEATSDFVGGSQVVGYSFGHFILSRLSEQLHQFLIDNNVISFITGSDNLLIATSIQQHPLFDSASNRLSSISSLSDQLIREIALASLRKSATGKPDTILGGYSFLFEFNDTVYHGATNPLSLLNGTINFYLSIAIPESNFNKAITVVIRTEYYILACVILTATTLIFAGTWWVSRPISRLEACLRAISKLDLEQARSLLVSTARFSEMRSLWSSTAIMIRSIASFQKYVPVVVVKMLSNSTTEAQIGMARSQITVLICEVENIIELSKNAPVDSVVKQASEYLTEVNDVVNKSEGVIDKFPLGGVMAFWGAPIAIPSQEIVACKTAIECKKRIASLNEKWLSQGLPTLFTRVGITVGDVLVGNLGTRTKLSYTIIGHPVNMSLVLKELNTTFGTSMIISENLYSKVKSFFLCRFLGTIGITEPSTIKFKVYELIGLLETSVPSAIAGVKLFKKALKLIEKRGFKESKELLQRFRTLPDFICDPYSLDLIAYCDSMTALGSNIPQNWEFVRWITHSNTTIGGKPSSVNIVHLLSEVYAEKAKRQQQQKEQLQHDISIVPGSLPS